MKQLGRVKHLKKTAGECKGEYVLYWMQSAQRIHNNHALEASIQLSNQMNLPLVVAFVIMPNFPNANTRHYAFMLEGLVEIKSKLNNRGIQWVLCLGDPFSQVQALSEKACALVMDRGYGRYIQKLRKEVLDSVDIDVYLVDTNLIVPVEVAYPKEAYAAYAMRPSLMRKLDVYCSEIRLSDIKNRSETVIDPKVQAVDLNDVQQFLNQHLNHLPKLEKPQTLLGGEKQAHLKLMDFVETGLMHYEAESNVPHLQRTSQLSAYLHFGQISPITIYTEVLKKNPQDRAFIEQLVVRRELSYNFVHYNDFYDIALDKILPAWALETLDNHKKDLRHIVYSLSELENAQTQDLYWNAAQTQMVKSGYMHNYMRMYWGKKIVEWSQTPQEAFETLIYLNDKYLIDGRDPNGYAGIAWCFGKHDRPFQERLIFGKVRYMNAAGLERKFDMEKYIKQNI